MPASCNRHWYVNTRLSVEGDPMDAGLGPNTVYAHPSLSCADCWRHAGSSQSVGKQ
jgi:hypothetical protein